MMVDEISVALEEAQYNHRFCKGCSQTIPLDMFYKNKCYKDGIDYYCKNCRNANSRKAHRTNKRKCSLDTCNEPHWAKGHCRTHYERLKRTGTVEGKKKDQFTLFARKMRQMKNYNIPEEQFWKRIMGECELCGIKPQNGLDIDHDHACCQYNSCGKCVRGFVCRPCNTSIGQFENGTIQASHPLIEEIIAYVKWYEKKIGI